MTTKRGVERRIDDLEDRDGTDADSGLVIAYYDEETDTHYDHEGGVLDTDDAGLVIIVPTDSPPEAESFGGEEV